MATEKRKGGRSALKFLLLALIAAVFVLGYQFGGKDKEVAPPGRETLKDAHVQDQVDQTGGTWTCSMHPHIQLPKPGKCPICFMDLIPVKKEGTSGDVEAVSLRQITLSSQSRKLAEVMVQPVERRSVGVETRMVGKVDYDETRIGHITAWMGGRIDKLYVDYTGSVVKKGQPMASIYSPELLTAQAELIQAVKAIKALEKSNLKRVKETAKKTAQAAKEKMRLLGLSDQQIQAAVQSGAPADHITIHAPMRGVVIQKDVVEGMYVKTGTRIYTIADLSQVWIVLEAYELDLPGIKVGQKVDFQTEAYPGELFKGKTVYIDPMVNEKTRTVRVRVNVSNRAGKLKPGMFVKAVNWMETKGKEKPLVIPASAPLITGKRAIVYVRVPGKEGTYEGREIVLGPKADDYYIVKGGLSEGEIVVTKGNFKIDSALQIMAKPSMMNPQSGAGGAAQMEKATFQVPAPLAFKLHHLKGSFDELKDAVKTGDLKKSKKAYSAFHKELKAIDATSLTGRPSLTWKDLTMLLGNDAFLGSESDTPEEAIRLFETLTDHFGRLKDHFRIDHPALAVKEAKGVPARFKEQLGKIVDPYLTLQASLAKDDFQSAKKAGKQLGQTIKGVDMKLLEGEAHTAWMQTLELLNKGLGEILGSKDITGVRSGFEPLSVGMAQAVAGIGVQRKGPLFELSCPMAFENKGATWVQQDKDIRNPYFGEVMLKCGEVGRQLKGE
jgi:Cu(I)/Ag(I) efflux system membrane fusion protein